MCVRVCVCVCVCGGVNTLCVWRVHAVSVRVVYVWERSGGVHAVCVCVCVCVCGVCV